jgi:hypothetical protein
MISNFNINCALWSENDNGKNYLTQEPEHLQKKKQPYLFKSQNLVIQGMPHLQQHQMSCIMESEASWIPIELTVYLLFYFPLKNLSLIWRRHHYRWRTVKCMPMFGARSLWAGRDHYRATPTSVFPVSSEGLPHSVASYDTQRDVENLF